MQIILPGVHDGIIVVAEEEERVCNLISTVQVVKAESFVCTIK